MLPILYHSDSFVFYSYPLMMGVAWAFACSLTLNLIKKFNSKIYKPKLLLLMCFISSWLGSKLLFILLFKDFLPTEQQYFWFGGGFIFYGGLIFGIFTTLFYFKAFKIPYSELKYLIPGLTFGHGIGRLGCYLAGCCYGINHIPTQLMEAAFLLGIGVYILRSFNIDKNLVYKYLVLYSVFRFIIEFWRNDPVRGMFGNFSTSQWIAAATIIICFILNRIRMKSSY